MNYAKRVFWMRSAQILLRFQSQKVVPVCMTAAGNILIEMMTPVTTRVLENYMWVLLACRAFKHTGSRIIVGLLSFCLYCCIRGGKSWEKLVSREETGNMSVSIYPCCRVFQSNYECATSTEPWLEYLRWNSDTSGETAAAQSGVHQGNIYKT